MRKFLVLLVLTSFASAQAAGTRTVDADQIKSSDHSKTWAMPDESGTLATTDQVGGGGSSGINLLQDSNPEMDDISGWTASGGSVSHGFGAFSIGPFDSGGYGVWDSNAAGQTYCSPSVSVDPLKSTNGEAYLWTRVASGTATHKLRVTNGTTTLSEVSIVSTATPTKQRLNFPIPSSGTINLCLASVAANEPSIDLDKAYLGEVTNIASVSAVSEWTAYTPTVTGLGTVSGAAFYWRKVGGDIEIRGRLVAGTATTTEARVSLPGGLVSVDSTQISALSVAGTWARSSVGAEYDTVLMEPSVAYVTFGKASASLAGLSKIQGTNVVGSGETLSLTAKVPIQGWSSSASAAAAEQTNFGWRSTTCTGSWSTNSPTYTCQEKRDGEYLFVRGKVALTGAPNSATLTLTVPGGRTIDTSKYSATPTASVTPLGKATSTDSSDANRAYHGAVVYNTTTAVEIRPIVTFSGNVHVVSSLFTTTNPFTWATGDFIEYEYSVPIVGWFENNKAPTLIGSVTSNSTGAERIERAHITGANISTNCTVSPCVVQSQTTGFLSSATRSGTGTYIANFSVAFADKADCVCSGVNFGGSDRACTYRKDHASTSASAALFIVHNAGGTGTDGTLTIQCMGQR